VAYVLCDLAVVKRNASELAASRALLEESLARFRQLGDELGAAQAIVQLGNLLSAEGDHELAREMHEESLTAREAARDARGIGLSLLAMAVAAVQASEPQRAYTAAQRALAVFDRTDDGPGRASTVMQLGYLAADAGRLREARELQNRALALWRAFAPDTVWSAAILLELADVDAALGEPERISGRLEQAAAVLAHIGDRAGVAYCRDRLEARRNVALTPK
jgi:tetratricopeptide (TPR) repeat protein